MNSSQAPALFELAWASAAGSSFVRTIPNTSSSTPGAASLETGFPPLNFESTDAGGIPPFGQDFNGILKWITQWIMWQQSGGLPGYDAAQSAAIGGYFLGATLISADGTHWWRSTVENNVTDPDTGGAGWEVLQAASVPWTSLTGVPALLLASSFTGLNHQMATSGCQPLPGGLILQWGTYTASTTDTAYNVTLPESFPNNHFVSFACVNFAGTVAGSWSAYATPAGLSAVTLTSDVNSGSWSDIPLTFFSIGN